MTKDLNNKVTTVKLAQKLYGEGKDYDKEKKESKQNLTNINELGTPYIPGRIDDSIFVLPIIGQIEGHILSPPQNKSTKYEHIIPQLVGVERDKKIRGLLVILNTVGGDVEAGLAISC